MAVCAAKKLGNIRFRIINDDDDKSVLYDNAENNYQSFISFVNESTSSLIIELSVPEGSSRESKDTGCVGLVVQFRKNK